jgi:hypothetical protein
MAEPTQHPPRWTRTQIEDIRGIDAPELRERIRARPMSGTPI